MAEWLTSEQHHLYLYLHTARSIFSYKKLTLQVSDEEKTHDSSAEFVYGTLWASSEDCVTGAYKHVHFPIFDPTANQKSADPGRTFPEYNPEDGDVEAQLRDFEAKFSDWRDKGFWYVRGDP